MELVRRPIDNTAEEKIVVGMIMSGGFLSDIIPILNIQILKNRFIKTLCKWCIEHYSYYEKAPGMHIRDIFDMEKGKFTAEDREITETLLARISLMHSEEEKFNSAYYLDIALEYIKKRELEERAYRIAKYVDVGDIAKAEEEMEGYKKITRYASGWYNPFDEDRIIESFDDTKDGIFIFPGQLGEFVGKIERGWLISIVGGFKRGKTWYMLDFAVQALTQLLKVAFVSWEMKGRNIDTRTYRRISAYGVEDTPFLYPKFDCRLNQTGECTKEERVNRITLLDEHGNPPRYRDDLPYRTCTVCRGTSDFVVSSWYESYIRPAYTSDNVLRYVKGFSTMFGRDNLRVKTYPRFSASISDLKRDLDILADDGFIPDVIIPDYAHIIKPQRHHGKDYLDLDEIWKDLAGLAEERHAIVVTGSQIERGTLSMRTIQQEGIAGWIGQLAHVDIMLALNQTKVEKKQGITRMGILAHRHREYNELESCVLLQQLKLGQTYLDAQITEENPWTSSTENQTSGAQS